MDWFWYILLLPVLGVGFFLTLLNLPGNWVMILGTAGYAAVTWPRHRVGWVALGFIIVVGTLAEVVESLAGSAGAKKAGGSARGGFGAFFGGLLGGFFLTFLIPIPVVGTIVGICVGAFLGAMLFELSGDRSHKDAVRIGLGAAHGRLIGVLSKMGFGVVIFLASALLALPYHWSL